MLAAVDPVVRTQLGTVIHMARQRAKLTQKQLGIALEANQSTVSTWETGSVVPAVLTMLRMADLLEVDVRAFFDAAISDYETNRDREEP